MINVASGAITFDDGLSITPHDTLESIATLPGVRETFSVQGRRQFALGTHPNGGQTWGVATVFIGPTLSQVWLQCLTCVDATALSLDNEKSRQIFHDEVLEAVKGEDVVVNRAGTSLEAIAPWGKISSVLDARGVQALLIVSYDQKGS